MLQTTFKKNLWFSGLLYHVVGWIPPFQRTMLVPSSEF